MVRIFRAIRRPSEQTDPESALFDRCWPIVWETAYSITGNRAIAEDAAQTAIVNVFRSVDRFDESRPLEPWVRRIAANAALSELRRQKRQPIAVAEPELYLDTPRLASEDGSQEVLHEVAALSEDRRLVVVLHFWLDWSLSDIADLLGIPQGTVASRLARALKDLRLRLEDEQHAKNA